MTEQSNEETKGFIIKTVAILVGVFMILVVVGILTS